MTDVSSSLDGRVAIVTAAAGEGIGQATARTLAHRGAQVVVTDSHERRTRETAAELSRETGREIPGLVLDVADRARCTEVVNEVVRRYGRIDILVNNAAVNHLAPLHDIEPEQWDHVIAVDLSPVYFLSRLVLPHMIEKRQGAIVNVATVTAWIGNNGREGPYAAAKAGMLSLTRTVAAEAGPYGVRCNAVAPGIVRSRFVRKHEATLGPEKEKTPLRRFGEPEEIASVIAFLASDASSFVTGETINASGGWYMRP